MPAPFVKNHAQLSFHSAKYVVDEMEQLVDEFGAKDIAFVISFCANSGVFMRSVMRSLPVVFKIASLGLVLLALRLSISHCYKK